MPKINLLSKQVSELIAAGEVVERPASVLKELIENSIDAGATIITVEIKNGGISYMRITDNGCGISEEDVPLAFMRHATSKITNSDDLNSISTLGFRGEALAAISSVSRVKLLTKTADSDLGTLFEIEGGEQMEYSPTGCPNGTTIIISDLFYNTPARMKFLKKDVSEANACANVIDRIALSHTEISFKFIRDGKQVLSTNGDKNLRNAVYSILGREFSSNLIDVNSTTNTISVSGLICKPFACKATRNNQYTFLNGRLVRSGTVIAAVEQAYKNSAMIGKFPSFVLYLTVPFDTVDVNVHPAKTEVRFSDEKVVFEAVYAAVKNSLSSGDTRPEIKTPQATFNQFERLSVPQFKQAVFESAPAETTKPKASKTNLVFETPEKPEFTKSTLFVDINPEPKATNYQPPQNIKVDNSEPIVPILEPEKEAVIIIGEAFNTYIVAQMDESVFLIDKHAAHERILFENLKKLHKIEVQVLLTPITVTLNKNEYNTIIENADILQQCGFEVEDFGINSLAVRAVPTTLVDEDLSLILSEIAESLIKSGKVQIELEDNLFHTVACKAAIKAGSKLSLLEMQNLAEKVLRSKEIMYCPHGRPVAFEIKKRELEKMFGRIQ
ncbi:MAG: DNA mismatch repair endonuclease MutL [Clostridia bacterium]|nr:DNA mismatch repair endonuclease MutL [Clostridia bacterium]